MVKSLVTYIRLKIQELFDDPSTQISIEDHVRLVTYCFIVYNDTPLENWFHRLYSQIFCVVLQTHMVLTNDIDAVNHYSGHIYDFFLTPVFQKSKSSS